MSDTQSKLSIATLGARETVINVAGTVPITGGDATTGSLAVTFDKAFSNTPSVMGLSSPTVLKAFIQASDVTPTGMNLKIYRILEADLADGSYEVNCVLVGMRTP